MELSKVGIKTFYEGWIYPPALNNIYNANNKDHIIMYTAADSYRL